MHTKPDLRVVLKWMIVGSGSVITDVRRLGILAMESPAPDKRGPPRSWSEFILAAGFATVALLVVYVAAYLCLVVRDDASWDEFAQTREIHVARYPAAPKLANAVFRPVHLVDRRVRRRHWQFSIDLDSLGTTSPSGSQTQFICGGSH